MAGSPSESQHGPEFVIIGAMKCATSTLHEQLARQPGFFMSEPKEPNYFSDDDVFRRGPAWYDSLFAGADQAMIRGESSTHYTKRPTHPDTVARLADHLAPGVRFIYVMRHPIDRLISQYVHEWTRRVTSDPIDTAVSTLPALVDYGRYAMQLDPYLDAFGPERILPVFFERLTSHPQEQLERVGAFLGARDPLRWDDGLGAQNASRSRERSSRLRDTLKRVPGLRAALRRVVPESTWERVKGRLWRLEERPTLSPEVREHLEGIFDADLARLGDALGVRLDCRGFKDAVDRPDVNWAGRTAEVLS